MANPGYVRSTDGSDADNGSTWALANASLAGAMADQAAGDRVWVSDNHAESNASSQTITMPGTLASPNQIWCGDDAAEPPTALAATATVTTTGASSITLAGVAHLRGISFRCGTGSTGGNLIVGNADANEITLDTCELQLLSTGGSLVIRLGAAVQGNSRVALSSTSFKFGAAGQSISLCHQVRIRGGSLLSGGTSPTTLFSSAQQRGVDVEIEGLDLSNAGGGINLVVGGANQTAGRIVFRGCRMPASWSGGLESTAITEPGLRLEMHACDDADSMFYERIADAYGTSREETTLTRTGGRSVPNSKASGSNPQLMSLKLDATSRLASYPHQPFEVPLEPIWNETVGSAVTVTLPILMDSASEWNDNDIVLLVSYPGTAGRTIYSMANSGPSDVLATATDLNTKFSTSSGWTTTGMSNPKQRKLQVTITAQEVGFLLVCVCLYKRAIVYVDKPTKA